jgi:hypothetical protein
MSSSHQIPLLIESLSASQLNSYRESIRSEIPAHFINDPKYEIVYKIADDSPADYVRAIQEVEILKTRLKQYDHKSRRLISLPSFAEIWNDPESGLADAVISAKDKNEAKWALSQKFGYKLATTFMPMYAKSIYEYLGVERVLDPCAGWGDRMTGALSSCCVKRYVGFDPNTRLVPGYVRIQSDFGNAVLSNEADHVRFSADEGTCQCEIYSLPFEVGAERLGEEKFEFAFTSPPFFDYEDYSDKNPTYKNWYKEFYEPLFSITERSLVSGAFFAIHIDDTSAGKIQDFLFQRVNRITSFQYRGKIGLIGGKSGKIRNVYLFQRS